jgi:hypothetical protein
MLPKFPGAGGVIAVPALDVASEFSQLINCGLVSRCCNALRIAADHMFIVGIEGKAVRGEVGDRIGF